jgi:superfamily II DNA or RNA helicase
MSARVGRLGVEHGVLMGGHKRQRWHSVQVASIDTLHRMEQPPHADLIIVDEAHMSLSPTWRKALGRYTCRVIGMTATPIRLDKKGLGRKTGGLFDSLVIGPSEEDLIKEGHLVGSRVLAPPPPADLGSVKKTAGEFDSRQMAAVCDKTTILGDIVKHWQQHAGGSKTVAFGIDQAHAKHITESFKSAGHQWAYVDADTPQDERKRIYDDLGGNSGLRGVSSVGCLTVGWDCPAVSCLIAARKTASLGLWKQMLGRGSRPNSGKTHFLVLDHVGNTHFHQPYGCFEDRVPWSLDGEAVPTTAAEKQERYVTCKVPAMIDGVLKYPCYSVFRAGPKECPYCGLVIVKQVAKIEVQEGELREFRRFKYGDYQPTGNGVAFQRISAFNALLDTARDRRLSVDWAARIFTERFGAPPPKEWMPR